MRKLRESERLLGEGNESAEVAEVPKMSGATYHRWRNRYGGMPTNGAKELGRQRNVASAAAPAAVIGNPVAAMLSACTVVQEQAG